MFEDKLRTPDAASEPVIYQQYLLTLPVNVDIQRFFWGAIIDISFYTAWVETGTMTAREAAEYIKQGLASRMEFNMLGTIVAVTRETLHSSMLLCDGSVYNKVDFPQLWEVLPASMKDATSLTLPDLRNLFLVGAGLDYELADTGGADTVTLTIEEMPSHSHTNSPHSHSEIAATSTIVNGGVEAPAASATPFPTSTGFSSVTIDNTGGGEAHENRPPFYAVVYAMIAKVLP